MRIVRIQCSYILEEDHLSPRRQHSGEDNRNDTRLIHIDTRYLRNALALAHSLEILSQLCL